MELLCCPGFAGMIASRVHWCIWVGALEGVWVEAWAGALHKWKMSHGQSVCNGKATVCE